MGYKSLFLGWKEETFDVRASFKAQTGRSALWTMILIKMNVSIGGICYDLPSSKANLTQICHYWTKNPYLVNVPSSYRLTDKHLYPTLIRAAALWCSGSLAYLKWMLCQSWEPKKKKKDKAAAHDDWRVAVALESTGTGERGLQSDKEGEGRFHRVRRAR